jgi:serine/threonine-protein kinase RIO1
LSTKGLKILGAVFSSIVTTKSNEFVTCKVFYQGFKAFKGYKHLIFSFK